MIPTRVLRSGVSRSRVSCGHGRSLALSVKLSLKVTERGGVWPNGGVSLRGLVLDYGGEASSVKAGISIAGAEARPPRAHHGMHLLSSWATHEVGDRLEQFSLRNLTSLKE